ncbi:MAG: GatB/YqeY domain-containing protein [Gammaproteobacteria bacterium]|nr:GatB/YqeY domain-containing protein [Gammaproteobacteria bacterium]
MSESLKAKITEDMKSAMRAKDKRRLGVIRLILAAIKQLEVDQRISLDDAQVLNVLDKMLKQRRDSLKQYKAAAREDLADQEAYEIEILQSYMPEPLSVQEIEKLVAEAITESGAASMREMGKVMGLLKPRLQGRAELRVVSNLVKQRLN